MEAQVSTRPRRMRTGACPLLVLTAAAVAATAVATIASASVVIHESTWMTDDQSYDAWIQSNIAALSAGSPTNIVDHNAASNFLVDGGSYNITSVTGDFISSSGFGGEGILVEVFSDEGSGSPSNTPTAQFFATEGNGLSIETFTDTVFGGTGMRFNVDLFDAGISLGEGSWWLSIVVVHETTPSQPYLWVRKENLQDGGELHIRQGTEAHGNDHNYTWGFPEWTPISQSLFFTPGDTAFRVEGAIIPAPSALALLAVAGLGLRSRSRACSHEG